MPISKDINASGKHLKPAKLSVTESGSQVPLPLRLKFTSAIEAIGAMCQDVLKTRGVVSIPEVQLMLAVRLELCTEEIDTKILQEALTLLADKSTCN